MPAEGGIEREREREGERERGWPPPRALTVAGSDSGGGAGVQADLKTFAVLGAWGMSAVTSVTVQNTVGVTAVSDVPPEIVAAQIDAVTSDIGVDAAKTGMLSSARIVEAAAAALDRARIPALVVDPVFVSKHGHALLRPEAVGALRTLILPLADLVTPNLPEASGLAGFDVERREDMRKAADAILALGARAVLVKGGHLRDGTADDLFVDHDGEEWLEAERIDTANTHGTGCVLSAAITAYLARGSDLAEAVRQGKAFVTDAIRHAARIGGGVGPVSPAWRWLQTDGGPPT